MTFKYRRIAYLNGKKVLDDVETYAGELPRNTNDRQLINLWNQSSVNQWRPGLPIYVYIYEGE